MVVWCWFTMIQSVKNPLNSLEQIQNVSVRKQMPGYWSNLFLHPSGGPGWHRFGKKLRFGSVLFGRTNVLPRNLTWNLKMMVSKRNLLFQGLLFRFHVKFQGCSLIAKQKMNTFVLYDAHVDIYTTRICLKKQSSYLIPNNPTSKWETPSPSTVSLAAFPLQDPWNIYLLIYVIKIKQSWVGECTLQDNWCPTFLVGGWTTQLKNMGQIVFFPNRGEKTYIWNHHLDFC